MKLEMAPMEGITTYVYRQAYARHFGKIDKYYTPFISLHREKEFSHKEKNEILPEHNAGIFVVPQVLTNSSEDFLRAVRKLQALGYEEVNINLGCPSGTVTAKGKGAGMLSDPQRLDAFLDGVFANTPIAVSVKTRLGMTDVSEWDRLLSVYRNYPLKALIVHARVRDDFYENRPDLEAFARALAESPWPVCYNGDIFQAGDYERIVRMFPSLERVMLGRGLLSDPYLPEGIRRSEQMSGLQEGAADILPGSGGRQTCDWERLRSFHDEVYRGYQETQMGEHNVLCRMKELWTYMKRVFEQAEECENVPGKAGEKETTSTVGNIQRSHGNACVKKIRKAGRYAGYEKAVDELFRSLRDQGGGQ